MTQTVILYGPQGIGKTTIAPALAAALHCPSIQDDWNGAAPLPDGALAITNTTYTLPAGAVAFHANDKAGLNTLLSLFQQQNPSAP